MIIEPIKNKAGKIPTNVEMIKIYYDKLNKIRNGDGCKTTAEKNASEDRFYKICGGSDNAESVMAFMKQIVDEPDADKAQKLFERALLPVIDKKYV